MAKAVVVSDAAAGLTDELEMELRGHLAAGFDKVNTKQFLKNGAHDATFAAWRGLLADCDVYHHIGHGQIRCTRHKQSFEVNVMYKGLLGNYPWCCPEDTGRQSELDAISGSMQSAEHARKLIAQAGKRARQLSSAEAAHLAEGYLLFGAEELTIGPADIARLDAAPRTLVYLSCCVGAWDEKLPMAFINKGTRYVIAYKRYADDRLSVATSMAFYAYWKQLGFAVDAIPKAYKDIVLEVGYQLHPALYELGNVTTAADSLDPNVKP